MAKYKAYPAYKDSGVEWLGEIPEHWRIQRIKEAAYVISGFPFSSSQFHPTEGFPLVRIRDINAKRTEVFFKGYIPNEAIINTGDILIGMDGDFNVSWWRNGEAALNQRVACIRANSNSLAKFIYYFIPFNMKVINDLTYFTTVKHLSNIDILKTIFALPGKDEINSIVSFLDHETAKIDNLIEKQQQLIELLKEKRQAVISHAVTKGLDPNVPMKDSGVEWLGKIPEDWQLKQIRHLCTSNGGGTPSKNNPQFWVGNIPWVSPKDMKVQYISDAEDHVSEDAVKQSSTKKIPTGSVLIVVRGMILVHSVPVAINTKVVTINQDMKALIPNGNISCDYLHLVLIGLKRILLELTDNSAHGTKCLRTDLFEKMWIPLPSLQQQHTIVSEINEKVIKIDGLIHLQEEAKALLQERRTALISAAVTGKIDLRDWVAPDSQDVKAPQEATA